MGRERLDAFLTLGETEDIEFLVVANQRISSAILEDCSHIEVALRNRLSERLQERLIQKGIGVSWTEDPTGEIELSGADMSRRLRQARMRVSFQKSRPLPSDVIAELTLGFWLAALSKRAGAIRYDLLSVFEGYGSRSFDRLLGGLNRVRVLRNRVAHHHRILHRDLSADVALISTVAGWLDPELQKFVQMHSRLALLVSSEKRD